jgi:hypothetical protein
VTLDLFTFRLDAKGLYRQSGPATHVLCVVSYNAVCATFAVVPPNAMTFRLYIKTCGPILNEGLAPPSVVRLLQSESWFGTFPGTEQEPVEGLYRSQCQAEPRFCHGLPVDALPLLRLAR